MILPPVKREHAHSVEQKIGQIIIVLTVFTSLFALGVVSALRIRHVYSASTPGDIVCRY